MADAATSLRNASEALLGDRSRSSIRKTMLQVARVIDEQEQEIARLRDRLTKGGCACGNERMDRHRQTSGV